MSRVGQMAGSARRAATSRAAIPLWIGGGLLVALVVAVIALGGLNPATSSAAQLVAGDEATTPLYTASVLDAHVTDEIEDEHVAAEDGDVLVVVTMRLENLADYPVGVGRSADRAESRLLNVAEPLLELSGITQTASARAWRTDDSIGGVILQPRVPVEMQLVWPVPAAAVASGTVTVDVYDADETRGQVILSSDNITWRRAGLAAQFEIDVEEAR
ncbi:MAG: hypothetical protein ACTHZW_06140 [Microbacteriaceae bacterium]